MPPKPSKKSRTPRALLIPGQSAEISHVIYQFINYLQRVMGEVKNSNAVFRSEWRQARGLATWTEERLEVLEARLQRLEKHAGLPPDPEVEKLRAILANWRPAAGAIGVKPLRGSMLDSRAPNL